MLRRQAKQVREQNDMGLQFYMEGLAKPSRIMEHLNGSLKEVGREGQPCGERASQAKGPDCTQGGICKALCAWYGWATAKRPLGLRWEGPGGKVRRVRQTFSVNLVGHTVCCKYPTLPL